MYGNTYPGLGAMAAAPAPVEDPGVHYTYAASAALLALGTTRVQIQVKNSRFRAYFLVANSTGAFTTKITQNGRDFQNAAVHNLNLWGTAQNPMPMITPYTFEKGAIVEIELTDLSAAPNAVDLAFIGVEIA